MRRRDNRAPQTGNGYAFSCGVLCFSFHADGTVRHVAPPETRENMAIRNKRRLGSSIFYFTLNVIAM